MRALFYVLAAAAPFVAGSLYFHFRGRLRFRLRRQLQAERTNHIGAAAATGDRARAVLHNADAHRCYEQRGAGRQIEASRSITAGAHQFTEIRILNALRAGSIDVKPEEAVAMERLLGAQGTSIPARLGLPESATVDEQRAAMLEQLAVWQRRAENPLSSREVADAASEVVRTCSGIYVQLQPQQAPQ